MEAALRDCLNELAQDYGTYNHMNEKEHSGSVVECLTRDRGAAGWSHCVVVLEQDTFIPA